MTDAVNQSPEPKDRKRREGRITIAGTVTPEEYERIERAQFAVGAKTMSEFVSRSVLTVVEQAEARDLYARQQRAA